MTYSTRTRTHCSDCGVILTPENGSMKKGRYYYKQCKSCKAKYWKSQREQDPKKYWERGRKSRVLLEYGITLDDYHAMYEAQGGVCAVCRKPGSRTVLGSVQNVLCIDHDHTTGKVRGLLCDMCNKALGMVNDDVSILSRLITYVEEHKDNV